MIPDGESTLSEPSEQLISCWMSALNAKVSAMIVLASVTRKELAPRPAKDKIPGILLNDKLLTKSVPSAPIQSQQSSELFELVRRP